MWDPRHEPKKANTNGDPDHTKNHKQKYMVNDVKHHVIVKNIRHTQSQNEFNLKRTIKMTNDQGDTYKYTNFVLRHIYKLVSGTYDTHMEYQRGNTNNDEKRINAQKLNRFFRTRWSIIDIILKVYLKNSKNKNRDIDIHINKSYVLKHVHNIEYEN